MACIEAAITENNYTLQRNKSVDSTCVSDSRLKYTCCSSVMSRLRCSFVLFVTRLEMSSAVQRVHFEHLPVSESF